MATQLSIFRVWIKSQEKYLSKRRSKSSWRSMGWAITAAEDSYHDIDDLEIHEFPTVAAIVHDIREVQSRITEERCKKAAIREESERKRREVREQAKLIADINAAKQLLRQHGEI